MILSWTGVMPAITTPFSAESEIDCEFLARHAAWLVDNGCTGIVACGSLGEGGSLSLSEKASIFQTVVGAVGARVPVIAAVSALTTKEAVTIAHTAAAEGCRGLMVLPPYVYVGDWPEMKAHVLAVIRARDFENALEIANNTEFGLTGAIYTQDRVKLDRARQEFQVGNLYFNRKCTGAMVGAHPFGGFNMSGTDSKAGGPDYLYLFTQAKSVAEKV